MKKIGILNFHYSNHNYGAVLQAAALAHKLSQLGYEAEHIDYIPKKKKNIKDEIKIAISLSMDFLHLKKLVCKILGKKYILKNEIKNEHVFEEFRAKWLKRGEDIFTNPTSLNAISDKYDAIIVGSDQVWRPKLFVNINDYYAYFLGFSSKKTKKISYAASFGVDDWEFKNDIDFTLKIKKLIKRFHSISVREDSGVQICEKYFDIVAQHVLDPTLMVGRGFFDSIIGNEAIKNNKKISYYKLDPDINFLERIKKISLCAGLESENIYYQDRLGMLTYNPVPEWLRKIRDSELIITDSFHCVCFAIIFNKEFYCCVNHDRGISRLESMLSILGLESRLIEDDMLDDSLFNKSKIDYEVINKKLNKLRETSCLYLNESLVD